MISGFFAENAFRQLTVYISLLIMLVIYLAVVNALTSERIVKMMVSAFFISAFLMSIIGIYQFFGDMAGLPTSLTGLDPGYTKVVFGFPRIHAFSKEPLYYANYIFIPLGIALALFFSKQAKRTKVIEGSGWLSQLADRLTGPWLLPLIVLLMI